MSDHFDLVVIGTGSAASGVASPYREAGRSVAVVDDRLFGETCANRGCDPKKVLARYEGRTVAANLLKGNHQTPNYPCLASTVFSLPPLACCGLTEEAGREQGVDIDVHHINLFALAMRHGLTAEQAKEPLHAYPSQGSNTQYML